MNENSIPVEKVRKDIKETKWLINAKKNLMPLSKSDKFEEAQKEWEATGLVNVREYADGACGLCEHANIKNEHEIQNTINQNKLLVGSKLFDPRYNWTKLNRRNLLN